MITNRFKVLDKIGNSLNDTSGEVNELLEKFRIPMYKYVGVLSQANVYNKVATFGASGTQVTLSLPAANTTRIVGVSLNMVPPYVITFTFTVSIAAPTGIFLTDSPTTQNATHGNSTIPMYIMDCDSVGITPDGTYSALANAGYVRLNSPRLTTGLDYAVSPLVTTCGFRELAYGQLEVYDSRTKSWYSVNANHLNKTDRRVVVHYHYDGINKTFILNMIDL